MKKRVVSLLLVLMLVTALFAMPVCAASERKVERFEVYSGDEIIRTLEFTYNKKGRVSKVVDTFLDAGEVHTTKFEYDSKGSLKKAKLVQVGDYEVSPSVSIYENKYNGKNLLSESMLDESYELDGNLFNLWLYKIQYKYNSAKQLVKKTVLHDDLPHIVTEYSREDGVTHVTEVYNSSGGLEYDEYTVITEWIQMEFSKPVMMNIYTEKGKRGEDASVYYQGLEAWTTVRLRGSEVVVDDDGNLRIAGNIPGEAGGEYVKIIYAD